MYRKRTTYRGRKTGRPYTKRRRTGYALGFGTGPAWGQASGRGGRPSQAIIRQPTVVADRIFVKLTKVAVNSLATGAVGAFVNYSSNPNDMKNGPLNSAFASGACEGFSKYCSSTGPYLSYIVHGFSLDVQMNQGNVDGGMAVGIMVAPTSASTPTAISQFGEQRGRLYQLNPSRTSRHWSSHTIAQIYGQTRQTVAIADSFSALYNAVPSSEVTLHLAVQGNSAVLEHLYFTMKITCYVEFFGRQTL